MCKAIEDMLNEARKQAAWKTAAEIAIRLIIWGKYSLDEICELTGLTLEEVQELAEEAANPV